ncbi:MAG: hypothetical protein WCD35_11320 [Mycobacteriales bacterium]
MRRRTALVATALLVAALSGCNDRPSAAPSPAAPTSSATPTSDPYTDLDPPTSPGVGSFDKVTSDRAYEAAHGLLALQLLEPATLTGSNRSELLQQLTGQLEDATIGKDLGGAPSRRGLDYRPLLARTVRLGKPFVEVVRSSYQGDQVQGIGGETGLRVTWDGAVRYHVTVDGVPRTIGYAMTIAYVFSAVPNEPGGMALQLVVKGSSHAAPVLTSCLAKGVLLPTAGAPTDADLGPGPYPSAPPGPACPV